MRLGGFTVGRGTGLLGLISGEGEDEGRNDRGGVGGAFLPAFRCACFEIGGEFLDGGFDSCG